MTAVHVLELIHYVKLFINHCSMYNALLQAKEFVKLCMENDVYDFDTAHG